MAVVETVFRVVGETMTVMGIYRDCFLQFLDFGITTKGADGVKGGEVCGGVEDGDVWGIKGGEGDGLVEDGSEGESGIGSTGRAAKRFDGRGKGDVDAGEAGRVKGVEGLEGPGHFWIMCPGCLQRKQSPFLVQRSRSSGVKGAR